MDLFISLGHRQCIEGKLQALKSKNKEFCNSHEADNKNERSEVQTVHFSASPYRARMVPFSAVRQNAWSGAKTHGTVLFSLEQYVKILAKLLANKLHLVIGSVISETQSIFVKDSQILDGILIVSEVVDDARKSKKEFLLFKVNFEKSYDFVDWGYLDVVMGLVSFRALWRKWIRECAWG
uniref:Reverse transcriptase domain-containing protein n=1 Tax=Medicago truncatula TaxID=3880 RepID=Q2HSP0_MEDTR|nr:hypothetical protein MtrDRAFT_AC151520g38v2 [Medicago truncatula]